MKTRNVLNFATLLTALVLLSNCGNPFDNAPAIKDPHKGLVAIHISDGHAGARTLLPSAPVFSRYTLKFTGEGKEDVTLTSAASTSSTITVELEGWSWIVTVHGYVTIQGADETRRYPL